MGMVEGHSTIANINALFVMFISLCNFNSEASFSPSLMHLLHLQLLRCPVLKIFVSTTTAEPIAFHLAHSCRVKENQGPQFILPQLFELSTPTFHRELRYFGPKYLS